MFACVDVYVNLLFLIIIIIIIYIFRLDRESDWEGWDRTGGGKDFKKWKKEEEAIFFFNFILCGSGIRGFFERARSVVATLLRFISIPLRVGGPESQVVPQELHDER